LGVFLVAHFKRITLIAVLFHVFSCTRSSVTIQISSAHMNEQNAKQSTQGISQLIYNIVDTEILLLSEGKKGTNPEYTLTYYY